MNRHHLNNIYYLNTLLNAHKQQRSVNQFKQLIQLLFELNWDSGLSRNMELTALLVVASDEAHNE